MKKTFLSILLLIALFSTISFAQAEEKEIEQSLKIYSSFQYLPTGSLPIYYFDLPNFSYNSSAVGFFRENKSKNRFIEYSLSFSKRTAGGSRVQSVVDTSTITNPPLMFFTDTYLVNSNELNIGLRFERGRWIKRLSSKKIKVGLGTSLRAFMHLSNLESTDADFFSREREQYYLVLGVVPRIRYNVNTKLYFTLQFPFDLLGFGIDLERIKNPLLSARQQENGGFNFDIGGEALIRMGVGYQF